MGLVATLALVISATLAGVASAQTVIATIDVGDNPFGVAVDPERSRAYVAHPSPFKGSSREVSVLDTSTNQKIDTIRVGRGPTDVAVDTKTGLLYVANNGGCCASDHRVFVVDPVTHAVVDVITVDPDPEWIEINPETRLAYVTYVFGIGRTRVAVLDLATNTLRGFIEVGDGQGAVAVDPKENRIYVGRYVAEGDTRVSEVVVIDGSTNTVIDRIQLSLPLVRSTLALVRGLSVDPHSNRLYVGHRNSDLVSVVDLKRGTLITTIPVGQAPHGVLFNPDNGRVYVGNAFSNTVSVMAAKKSEVVATVPVGVGSRFLALDPRTEQLYTCRTCLPRPFR